MRQTLAILALLAAASPALAQDYGPTGGSVRETVRDPYAAYRPQPAKPVPVRGRREATVTVDASAHSAWGTQALVEDRVLKKNDLVQVVISQKVTADTKTDTDVKTESNLDSALTKWFTLHGLDLSGAILDASPTTNAFPTVSEKSSREHKGQGDVQHDSTFQTTLTARVGEVLPNGNYFLEGRYEVSLGGEISTFSFHGECSPDDISAQRRIDSDRIFDANISYTGRGVISDANRRGFLAKFWDHILRPF